ncbi:sensor histidine kinase [Falsiroseomonas sp. E2-1-a20]|uniref:sensor histidine kinase n=1 Tax=Falsiroseomonas sp. E2-1-a20 TaxID=3239300 RepID=UPI003F391BC3
MLQPKETAGVTLGRPLAWHLGLLCAALLLPMVVLEAFLLLRIAASERDRHEEAARDAAHHIAVSLDRGLTTLQAVVEVLATSDHLLSGDLEAFRQRVRQMPRARDAALVLHDGDSSLMLTKGSGVVGHDDAAAVVAAADSQRAQVSGLLGLETGLPSFAVTAPVPGPDAGPGRLLSLRVPVGELHEILERERLPSGMVATVTDSKGLVLARSEEAERFLGLRRRGAGDGPPPGEGWQRGVDANGVPVLVAHAEAGVAGWTAWVFIPETAFAAPLQQRLLLAAGIALVLAGLAVALALAFSRRIAEPIQALAASARRPLSDRASVVLQVHSGVREVNAVAAALAEARREAATRLGEIEEVLDALDLAQVKVVDPQGRILVWTTGMQRLFGWTAAEAVGRDALDLLRSEYPEPLRVITARLRETGHWQGEIRQCRRDGTPMLVASQWSLRLGPDGQALAVVQASTDVTALRQAEAQLRDTQAELRHIARLNDMGTLASALAHEISQPLTASASFTEAALRLLESDTPLPRRLRAAREAMREAADQAVHAGEIVRRLRDFIGGTDGERIVTDLNVLVRDAASLALGGVRQRGIALRLDLAPEPLPALVDAVQIRQVVVNLVRNAIEAMEDRPRRDLLVRVGRSGEGLLSVAVIDSGGGLPEEIRKRLFEAFVTTKREGMGVGLSICRAIVEEHGGRLACAPNPGGGSVFSFTLAAIDDAAPDRVSPDGQGEEEASDAD